MNWNTIRARILDTLAAQVIPQVERYAIELILKNGQQLRGKGELALNLVMKQYATLTAATPLAMTTLDDDVIRKLAQDALNRAWIMLDDRVKQAARDVGAAIPTPEPRPTVTVDPSGGDNALGRPATDADFGPSFTDVPLDPTPTP
ncbi:hypothetical protein [Deinococcus yunweiensis]|uniref:hypothetical protein n=1 Tax=Deinococcus yunweiensis TaxID=367282 RepID=UPI00398E3D50